MLRFGLQATGHPGGKHDLQHLPQLLPCPGNRFVIAERHLIQGAVPGLAAAEIPRPGCQPDEEEVQQGVVDEVVAFIGEAAVEVGNQLAALLQGQRPLEQIDVQNAADLLHIVAFAPGRREIAPLDPVLDGVGLQPGDAGHLAQGQPAREKQRLEHLIHPAGVLPFPAQGRSGNRPLHLPSLLSLML